MSTLSSTNRPHRQLTDFFLWTLAISYLLWGVLVVFRIPAASAVGGAQSGLGLALLALGGFVPSFAGIIFTGVTGGRKGLSRLWRSAVAFRFGGRYYLLMLLMALGVGAAQLLAQWAFGSGIKASEPLLLMMASPAGWIGFVISIIVLGPVSEEFGWRGYAQSRLPGAFTPLAGSLVLGAVWAVWHLPLYFVPGTSQNLATQPVLQFLIFSVGVISYAVMMTWLYNATGQSLGAAILMHALLGAVGTLVTYLTEPGLMTPAMQAAGYLVVAVIIVRGTGGTLGAGTKPEQNAA